MNRPSRWSSASSWSAASGPAALRTGAGFGLAFFFFGSAFFAGSAGGGRRRLSVAEPDHPRGEVAVEQGPEVRHPGQEEAGEERWGLGLLGFAHGSLRRPLAARRATSSSPGRTGLLPVGPGGPRAAGNLPRSGARVLPSPATLRRALEALCRLVVRIFFRRVEVVGEEHLPEGGLLLAPNHPNGLMDPLLVFTQADRPASFLAKAPLFDTFLVKHFVRAFDALPVYRAQDGYDTTKNRETLAAAAKVLARGGAIAIFPEGKSHGEPRMTRLKTGAARIALGGRASGPDDLPVHIIPTGIFYTDARTFRSDAAIVYGAPIEVPKIELDDEGEPPREAAAELTALLREGLGDVVLQGESHEVLKLSALATRLVRGARRDRGERPSLPELDGAEEGPLARERRLRHLLIARHAELTAESPAKVAALIERMRRLEALFVHHGIGADRRARRSFPAGRAALSLLALIAFAPLALAGALAHYPVYRLVGLVAGRVAGADEVALATLKMLGGVLFFPVAWIVTATLLGIFVSPLAGLGALVALPVMAYVALAWFEALPRSAPGCGPSRCGSARTISCARSRPSARRSTTSCSRCRTREGGRASPSPQIGVFFFCRRCRVPSASDAGSGRRRASGSGGDLRGG